MDEEQKRWHELLDELIGRERLSRSQVARRADVSSKTITSWLRGDVQSPRRWQPLARVLQALNAGAAEANAVLAGAGHPPVQRLARRSSETDATLLAAWLRSDAPFMPPDRLVKTLIGRQDELTLIEEMLQRRGRCVLVGMAGVGKTALAVEVAHRLRLDYPDGVFWGDLRAGVADAVLESWGQSCGVHMERLTDFNSRAAAIRAIFSRKRALIILDDVLDSRQALQMIPAQTSDCAVLATTRSEDVAHGLARMQPEMVQRLGPMQRGQSLALLGSIVGAEVLAQAEKAADEIAAMLGDMPLALHICGALSAGTGITLEQMAVLLRDLRTRLEHLRLEQKPLVRLAFEQSWELLDERARRALATMAIFSGRSFSSRAFAACMTLSEPEATLLLGRLCSYSLLTAMGQSVSEPSARRFQQHALLAAFVAEKLDENDPVWMRFSRFYGDLAHQQSWWRKATQATWGNVMAGMAAAHRLEDWPLVLAYAQSLTRAWQRRGYHDLAREGYRLALDAARALEDAEAVAETRLRWGHACLEQSDYEGAESHLRAALADFEALEQTAGAAEAQYHLARVAMEQSRHNEAEAAIQAAYRAFEKAQDARGMARSLYQLGYVVYFRGDYERAAPLAADAILSQQHLNDDLGLLRSHRLATQIFTQLGRIEEADRHCQAAARLVAQVDDRVELAAFYYTYADVLRQQKAFEQARRYGQEALALFREMADGSSHVNALLLLAGNEVYWNDAQPQRQQFEAGLDYCREGMAVCQAVGYELGKAFVRLIEGRLRAQQGNEEAARALWEEALEMARALQHSWLQQRLQTFMNEQR